MVLVVMDETYEGWEHQSSLRLLISCVSTPGGNVSAGSGCGKATEGQRPLCIECVDWVQKRARQAVRRSQRQRRGEGREGGKSVLGGL